MPTLHNKGYTFDWILLELVNTHKATSGDQGGDSHLTPGCSRGTPLDLGVPLDQRQCPCRERVGREFFPYWTDIEGGDLNGDGDEELVMYRNRTDTATTLISRNLSGAAIARLRTWRILQPTWRLEEYGNR